MNKKEYDKKRYLLIKTEKTKFKSPDPIESLSETDKAYIAGIIDGEGSIYARNERKTIYPTIAVHMTDKNVIEWLNNKIGGQKVCAINRKELTKTNKPFKTQYLFRICGKKAQMLCNVIIQYLIVKKKHAEIVTNWPIDVRNWKNKIPKYIQTVRTQLGKELTDLNGNIYTKRHK